MLVQASKVCKISIESFGYKEGIFNFSAINQKNVRKSCVSHGIQKLFNNIPARMCSCTHTYTVVCKYVCMYMYVSRYHCFKIKRYKFFYNVFVREARSPRPVTGHIL